jgi:hypothetical protein
MAASGPPLQYPPAQGMNSLAVGDPDVFYLVRVMEKPAALALVGVEPVNGAAFVGEDLLQVADGERFCRGGAIGAGEDQMASTSSCSARIFRSCAACPVTMFTAPAGKSLVSKSW